MPSVRLHTTPAPSQQPLSNPLPQLLQTPSGLAILELQATINIPSLTTNNDDLATAATTTVPVGRLVFPDYNPELYGAEDKRWMKRVYLYVGKHQRMTGEVKKLGKPLAVIRKRDSPAGTGGDGQEELEIAEIVYWKLLFALRPEPVGIEAEAENEDENTGEAMDLDEAAEDVH